MYTEYVFESKKIDVALCQIKAAIFDIVASEQEKISSVREKASNMQDTDISEILGRLCDEQDDCVHKLVSFSNELAKILKKLDSYSRELKRVEDKNNAIKVDDLSRKVELAEQLLSSQPQIRELVDAVNNGGNVEELLANMNQGQNTNAAPVNAEPQMAPVEEPKPRRKPRPNKENSDNHNAPQIKNENVQAKGGPSVRKERPRGNPKKEERVIMPYNDDISVINLDAVANGEVAPTAGESAPAEGENKEERVIMPYNDDISVINLDAVANGETAPTEGESAPAEGENKEERVIMPYNDDISVINLDALSNGEGTPTGEEATPTEGESAPAEGENKEERVIMPYNDDISVINLDALSNGEDTPTEEEAAPTETVQTSTEEKKEDSTEVLSLEETSTVETSTEAVVFSEPVVDTMKNNGPIPVIVSTGTSSPENNDVSQDSGKLVFNRKTSDEPKAILTTADQTSKLRNSLGTQEALLSAKGFFSNGVSDATKKEDEIQNMMNQANQLYNDGKVDEAQKMYDDISVMSKKLNINEGAGLVA